MTPFDQPIDFLDALKMREVRDFIPTDLGHEELKSVGAAMRERSLMLARVSNAEFGNRVLDLSIQVAQGRESNNVARRKLKDLLAQQGYKAEPGEEGTIKDLKSNQRLNLILRMQSGLCFGYAQWRQAQSASVLEMFPAAELYRAYERKEPRDWPTRWAAHGGEFYDGGRMVAARNAHIWTAISAFGLPYAPFDFNSGMDTRLIGRAEAVELGVIAPQQVIPPQKRDFERDISVGVETLSKEMEDVLVESLGKEWAMEDGVLYKANEARVEQMRNNLLLANLN